MKKKISEIMSTKLVTIQADDSLDKGYTLLKKNKIRHLPVLNKENRIVGVISERNFQRGMNTYESKKFDFDTDKTIADYMSKNIHFVEPETDVSKVIQLMIEEKISSVIILKTGVLLGVVTTEDLLFFLKTFTEPDQKNTLKSAIEKFYRKPIDEIAFRLAELGV